MGGVGLGWVGLASSAQHHEGDGPTSSLGPVSHGAKSREQCAVGGLVVAGRSLAEVNFLGPSGFKKSSMSSSIEEGGGAHACTGFC